MKPGGSSRVPDPERVPEILPDHLPDGHLSIAVFGPGEGEAIVVRLPDGSVGVVDGCREPKEPPEGHGDPVRELLSHFEKAWSGPGPFRLAFVCMTHPHQDHYRGLGRLIEAFQGRIDQLWTVTHATPQYVKVLPAWLELTLAGDAPDRADVEGLERVLERFHAAQTSFGSMHEYVLLSQGKNLLSREMGSDELLIQSCGPADGDLRDAHAALMADMLPAAEGKKISRRHDPNLTSGALLLRWGAAAILLGGDLLRGKNLHSGWQRAMRQIRGEVQVINVAHHASEEAHLDELWDKMHPALAIVTPFKHGRAPNPPRPRQIQALARSSVVAITSPPAWDGEPDAPVAMQAGPLGSFKPKNSALPVIVPKTSDNARKNAVAVSLDAAGKITRFVLAGAADVYLPTGTERLVCLHPSPEG